MTRRIVERETDYTSRWDLKPNTYMYTEGNDVLRMACGKGHVSTLDHEVQADGKVNPSIVCNWADKDGNRCDEHYWAQLNDWTFGYRDFRQP